MKRRDAIDQRTAKNDWLTYITNVLAFIGLWQVLSNGSQLLTHWF